MGAISSEILHLLKVKLPLQNDQRWLLLLSWFSKFFGGRTPDPPFQTRQYDLFFNQTLHTLHKPKVKSEVFNSWVKTARVIFY